MIGFSRRAALILGLIAACHVLPALAAPKTLSGTVVYRERIALPPSARLQVSLLDVSLADAPSKVLARTVIRPRGQVPLPYRLRFDDTRIRRGHSYALQAEIRIDGRLWFITTTRHSVFTGGADNTEIVVERVGPDPR
ncbi:YbaY family lipoprotein [Bradyrhizobium prioriisuperbiae]|uniref:YbaY family lipoprotein n=1 Tax=Bradyrhizobium prioriisuperbiae TaxID=2854389 RepID=UPI0028E73C3A|nr:YbaY family lipoprotein [Bradyrhizobium prioritasuperba]